MSLFDTMKDTLSVKSQGVAQKVTNATESVKLNNQIKNNQKMIEKIMYHVGEKCFEINGMQEGTPYDEMFLEIRRLQEENVCIKKQIDALLMDNICSKCGFQNSGQSKFCINCGAVLDGNKMVQNSEKGKSCVCCGTVNLEQAEFCVECGSKLE